MKPQLDPIPLHEMPRYEWWSSIYHKDWYYHTPRQHFEIDPQVLERTLDPCLKPLALLFLDYGLFTGPSCQGLHDDNHNLNKRQNAYLSLLRDADIIRTRGLILRNVENDEEIIYFDPMFRLPWSYEQFFSEAEADQHGQVGYLPFYFEDEHVPIVQAIKSVIQCVYGASITVRSNYAVVKVKGSTMAQQCETWNNIYKLLVM